MQIIVSYRARITLRATVSDRIRDRRKSNCHRLWDSAAKAGSVEMRGADYDWNDRSWAMSADKAALSAAAVLAPDSALSGLAATGASPHQPAPAGGRTAVASQGGRAPAAAAGPSTSPQLGGIRFALKRGELLGICGEVHMFSCMLAALLPSMLRENTTSSCLNAPLLVFRKKQVDLVCTAVLPQLKEPTMRYRVLRTASNSDFNPCRWGVGRAASLRLCWESSSPCSTLERLQMR